MSAILKIHGSRKRNSQFEMKWPHRLVPWIMAGSLAIFPFSAIGEIIDDAIELSFLQANGNASTQNTPDGIVLQLTPSKKDQAGSVFTKETVKINKGFSTAFAFQITPSESKAKARSESKAKAGAEGFAFVVQNVQPDYVGESSYGLGYYDSSFKKFKQSLAVEFDTWDSGEWAKDYDNNHIGIHTQGDFKGPTKKISPSFKNGNIWYAWIDYDGNQLVVRTSQDKKRPEKPSMTTVVNLTEIVGNQAVVGFTAGTGGSFSQHEILAWRFRERFNDIDFINPDSKKNPWRFQQPGKVFQDSLKNGILGPEMVVISKSKKDKIEQRFAMGRYEVRVAEFKQFVEATGYQTDAEKGNGCVTWNSENNQWNLSKDTHWRNPSVSPNEVVEESRWHHVFQADNYPVVCVSWNDATAYANWLTTQTGQKYRLPTETEWEYAARANTETDYWWGNDIKPWWSFWCNHNANCWNCDSRWDKKTAPVSALNANPFGLYGVLGNVWEWTISDYDVPEHKTYRGGSFNSDAKDLHYSVRHGKMPTSANENRGIRLVRE